MMLFHSSGVRTKKSISIAKALHRLGLEESLELGPGARSALKYQVATLKQRPDVFESELREEVAQVGHSDAAVTADVYAAEQSDVGCQTRQLW